MSDIAVRVTGLGKKYELGAVRQRHDTLRDRLAHGWRSLRHSRDTSPAPSTTFWAVRDVSFDVRRGQVLGLIGRNGAGKSTVLKMLSRITVPTEGRAELYGRLGSLLEVGTGFNTELTGRENVYLNGAIMGMGHAEIDRKFDAIVDFSGVEKFIDTPVKRYSSGMYVRLAFAVAAHLEPEILIVDEVLAVGDAAFQKKCLGKMDSVAKEGRTVIFVSHNMAAVQHLCTHGIVLGEGSIAFQGSAVDASEYYLGSAISRTHGRADLTVHSGRSADCSPVIKALGLCAPDGKPGYVDSVRPGDDLLFEIHFDTGDRVLDNAVLGVQSALGERVFTVGARFSREFRWKMQGAGVLTCRVPRAALAPGEYRVMVAMGRRINPQDVDCVEDALTFRVETLDYFGTGEVLLPGQGYFAVQSEWALASAAEPVASVR